MATHRIKYLKKMGLNPKESYGLDDLAKISGIKESILQEVFDRGIGAWKTNPQSVRQAKNPQKRGGPKSKLMSPEQWGYARVYSFLNDGQTSKTADKDLKEKANELIGEGMKGVKNIFCRIGSKRDILDKLYKLFPKDYETFVDCFTGSGVVFFNLPDAENKKTVINDFDKNMYQLFKLLKSGLNEDKINAYVEQFKRLNLKRDFKSQSADFHRMNDFYKKMSKERSKEGKFVYLLMWNCSQFGGRSNVPKDATMYRALPITKIQNGAYKPFEEKIKHTTVLNKDYKEVIKKYDAPKTFFFLDPPYEESEGLYEKGVIDYEEMNTLLKNIKGKFMLTINDSAYIRKTFKGFHFKGITLKRKEEGRREGAGKKDRKELIITNYIPQMKGGCCCDDELKGGGIETKEELKDAKNYALSNTDIENIIGKTNIFTYPELENIRHIDEVFKRGKNGIDTAIMLFLTDDDKTGHWIGLIKKGNTIEMYDPYGNKPEKLNKEVGGRMNYKQDPHLLREKVEESGYHLIHNSKQVQPISPNINTCGRHAVMRVMMGHLPLDEYNKKIINIAKQNGVSVDDIATALTYDFIGK